MAYIKNKPLEAEVFDKANQLVKRGLVARLTTIGAYVYDPKKQETEDAAEWFPYQAPNGTHTTVIGPDGAIDTNYRF